MADEPPFEPELADVETILRELEPTVDLRAGERWADNGRIICSSGVAAGTDMALHVISRLHGDDGAARAAHIMEYEHWPLKVA